MVLLLYLVMDCDTMYSFIPGQRALGTHRCVLEEGCHVCAAFVFPQFFQVNVGILP